MSIIHSFDSAPEHVKKLAFAIMYSIGPSGIPEIEPKAFLSVGERAGINADSQAAAFRWLARYYQGTGSKLRRNAGKQFEKFALAIEKVSREKGGA